MAERKFISAAISLLLLNASPAFAQAVNFDGGRFPCISFNIETAQNAGQPANLTRTTVAATIRANRRASCGPARGYVTWVNRRRARVAGAPASCDEYPFASSGQGGAGAQILVVPAIENSRQGGVLARFYNRRAIGNGGAYSVTTSNVPVVGPNIGDLRILVRNGIHRCYER